MTECIRGVGLKISYRFGANPTDGHGGNRGVPTFLKPPWPRHWLIVCHLLLLATPPRLCRVPCGVGYSWQCHCNQHSVSSSSSSSSSSSVRLKGWQNAILHSAQLLCWRAKKNERWTAVFYKFHLLSHVSFGRWKERCQLHISVFVAHFCHYLLKRLKLWPYGVNVVLIHLQ